MAIPIIRATVADKNIGFTTRLLLLLYFASQYDTGSERGGVYPLGESMTVERGRITSTSKQGMTGL